MPTSGSLELRLFGAPSIQARPGFDAAAVLAQPKRFALLAYLAAATPYDYHRRDILLGLFWPEADQEHGRTALRKAIHVLRRELGHDVILSRGEAEVGLAEGVWCDVRAFEEGLSSGRLAEALALYRADLLPGLYLAEAPEFERWLEETRGSLRRRAADAGWALSDRLERGRDPDQAARWAQWAWALAPDDERGLRRLLALLGRLGDRAGAMRAYEEFTERLSRDYQVTPDAETRRLLEAISAGGGSRPDRQPPSVAGMDSASPASVPDRTPGEDGRRSIAVFPFRVHGDETAAYLHEGLVDLLSTNLDHAGSLRTIDPHALLGLVAREAEIPLDPARAGELARHFGAHHYVLGSVVSAAGRLRITATLYQCEAAADSAQHLSAAGAPERLFDLVDDLTNQLLGELHPGPGQRLIRLATTTTTSLPALKAYLAGEKALRHGRYVDAVDAFRGAVDLDPEFALAWYRLAFFLSWPTLPQPNMTPDVAERALSYRERLSPRDRALLEALHASLVGEADESERRYHELLALHPEDVDGWIGLAQTLTFHNEARGRAILEARGPSERALALDPGNATALLFLCYFAHLERKYDESRALISRVPGSDFVHARLVHAIGDGDPAEREDVFRFLSTAPDGAVYEQARFVATLTGDLAAAGRIADLLADPARPAIVRGHAPVLKAFLELAAGRWGAGQLALAESATMLPAVALEYQALLATLSFLPYAESELERLRSMLDRWDAASVPRGAHPYPAFDLHGELHAVLRVYFLGTISARLGDSQALAYASQLDTISGSNDAEALARDFACSIRARHLWRAGDAAAALEALDRSRRRPRQITVVLQSPFYPQTAERWLRAELLRHLGRFKESLRWYGTLAQASLYDLIYLGPSHLRLGQVHQDLGDLCQAARHFAQFTELWADCDPELRPLVAEAERRLARLPPPGRRSPPRGRLRVG
jgi:serine/threonine-protein kinase